MLDITNYNVKLPITKAEYDDRVEKGLIKYGESVAVLNEGGFPAITEYIMIPQEVFWKPTINELKKNNWLNKRLLVNIYKGRKDFWAYMVENNIIPVDIVHEIEIQAKYGKWRTLLKILYLIRKYRNFRFEKI